MKIKIDFVSNSSSTSFVYISDDDLSEEAFLKAAGVNGDGPVGNLFRQMHSEISSSIRNYGAPVTTKEAADGLAGRHEFTPEVIERIKKALEEGKEVVTATLSSDGTLAESLLCVTMFEIESDEFYINAYNNVW